MAILKKFNIDGKEVGEAQVDDRLANAQADSQMIKDYIIAIRKNARQWSASTKGRSDVKHTTKKPRPQKGSGNARQGSLVAPQFRGGGIVFGPKPKFDMHTRINKKERRAAVRAILGEMIRDNKIAILDTMNLDAPKTKNIAQFMKNSGINRAVLFVGEGTFAEVKTDEATKKVCVKSDKHKNFARSTQNIPGADFTLAANICGYEVMRAHHVVLTEEALKEITEWLC